MMKIMHMQVAPIGTNCYILVDEKTNAAAVIDPGGSGEAVLKQLEGLDVKYILLTHGHYDHTGAVNVLRAALPGVKQRLCKKYSKFYKRNEDKGARMSYHK